MRKAEARKEDMEEKKRIEIAVIGSSGSGKTALCRQLNEAAQRMGDALLVFDEHHSHEDMDCDHHQVALQVVDATDLENSLVLTPSLMDHQHHLVIAINRYDLLLETQHRLDIPKLTELFGVPILTVSATTGEGVEDVVGLMRQVANHTHEHAHQHITRAWEQNDEDAFRAFVHGALTQTLIHAPNDRHTRLEKIDAILTRKWTGIPILVGILAFVFWCTFLIGEPIQDLLQMGVDALHDWIIGIMPEGWLESLLAEGIVVGVGSLLTALPNIIVLFFFLSLMEDTGYMARVAFLMDGMMHHVGLHGRSAIPLLMGFDCNVPAIMAAKDIREPKNRALTMLMVPFMSCSARLPVYILFISTFFSSHKALVLGSLYALGIGLSFLFATVMKRTRWFRHPDTDCVNELPDFRLPTLKSIGKHIWLRVADFLEKISTVVLCASIIIWALEYFPTQDLSRLDQSWIAAIGQFLDPVMHPLGFDWRMSVCLLTGLPAKEAIASTFAMLIGGDLSAFTPVSAYAFLVFTLLYFPCVATVAAIQRELNWKWALFTVVHSLVLAWVAAFIVNQIGMLI